MKGLVVVLAVVVGLLAVLPPATAGELDPVVARLLKDADPSETVSVVVFMADAVDVLAMNDQLNRSRATRESRHYQVVTALQAKAVATQGPVLSMIERAYLAGGVEYFEPFWIANCIRVDATPAVIHELAARDDVGVVYYNYPIELIEAEDADPVALDGMLLDPNRRTAGPRSPEPGVNAVRAPEVWAYGYDGTGVLVSTLDTGVEGSHPALASRWRGVADPRYAGHPEWAFFDPVTSWTFPQDSGSHGTHTMGSVCGGAPGDQVGVAPGAQWIHAAVIDRASLTQTCTDAVLAYQWLIDPDGNPSTVWDVPDVCSNSWGIATSHSIPPWSSPCDSSFWSYLDACEAAGTVILFSAGNEGSAANTLRRPADRATDDYRTCSVGGINANSPPNWTVYNSSSRGPTYCSPDGSAAIKPEVTAPAVSVRSSTPGSNYGTKTGTSMASPHVNGVVALMRQACPDLTPDEIKQILYDTAEDLGPVGKDNDFGYGLVDAYEAVLMAEDMCGPHPPEAFDLDVSVPWGTPIDIELYAEDDLLPDPPGGFVYLVTALPQHGSLTDTAAGPITSVPYTLFGGNDTVTYVAEAGYAGADSFAYAANDGGVPPEGGQSNVATVSITVTVPSSSPLITFPLNSDPGWAVEGDWAFGQPTGAGSHDRDPSSGYSGDNVYGYNLNGDYSNNMTQTMYLTTPALDMRLIAEAELRFWRWLGVERVVFDRASIEISTDGVNWNLLWVNGGTSISDGWWSYRTIDISTYADGHETVYLRWGMGPTDDSGTYPGWNIDDVEIWGVALPPPMQIVASDPADGAVDARQPIDPNNLQVQGWDSVVVTFSQNAAAVDMTDFALTEECVAGACDGVAPSITNIVVDGVNVTLTFDRPIDPEAWTVLTYLDGGADDVVRLGFLPADADASLTSNTFDVLAAIDLINDALGGGSPDPIHCDIDRSGTISLSDLLVLVDLLNGTAPFDAYLGAQLPAMP